MQSTSDIDARLERADAQVALYARDLKRAVDAELKRTNELREAYARLEALDRLKTDFLSFVSHHLRTPLTALSAFDMLEPGGDPKEQAEIIDIVRSGIDQLQVLIHRALEYFTWLGRPQVVTAATTDLVALVRSCLANHPSARERSADVRVHGPPVPCLTGGAPQHLAIAVDVVIDNAFKFSQPGQPVELSVIDSATCWALRICDRGLGVSRELTSRVFEPFTIADLTYLAAGKGLSLALARAVLAAHGGSIRLESAGLKRGTTVIMELLKARTAAPE